jgi:hypothetical protein
VLTLGTANAIALRPLGPTAMTSRRCFSATGSSRSALNTKPWSHADTGFCEMFELEMGDRFAQRCAVQPDLDCKMRIGLVGVESPAGQMKPLRRPNEAPDARPLARWAAHLATRSIHSEPPMALPAKSTFLSSSAHCRKNRSEKKIV